MQLGFRKDGTCATSRDMISISQIINGTSSGEKPLSFFDRMFIAISYCLVFGQDRTLLNVQDITVAEFVREVQQHSLLGNTEHRRVSRIAVVSIRPIFSKKCYAASTLVCKKLSHKGVSLGLVYFTSTTLYRASLSGDFWTILFAPCERFFSAEIQNFESYRTILFNTVFALVEEVQSAATAADRTFRAVLVTGVPVSDSEEVVSIQESIAVAVRIFRCSKKDIVKVAQTRLRQA